MATFKKKPDPPKRYDMHRTIAYPANKSALRLQATKAKEKTDKKLRFTRKKTVLLLFAIILTPFLVIGIWDARNFSRASEQLFGSGNLIQLLNTASLKETETGKVNMLIIGYSADDPGHDGATLTDSIMILSLNKETKTGSMLSIPRDLYVEIPGYGHAKINEAYQDGENGDFMEAGYSRGGIGLLEKIISENFGIEVHYNAIINYGAVRDMVAALDGVTVTIQSSDPRGLYDPNFLPHEGGPLKLANGVQQIDSQTALKLTRARGSTGGSYGFLRSDFNRTEHQRLVLAAIKDKITWKLVLDPRQNGELFDAAARNIKTDLKIDEVLPFYQLLNSVPTEKLQPIGLNNVGGVDLLRSYQTPSGQSALIPAAGIDDFSQIQAVLKTINAL